MASISLILAVLIIFGYILHSTMHPEDVITGSQSEHFAPSLWFYFVPAQATHFPYNIFSPILSVMFESSIVIALSSAAVMIVFGSQVERSLLSVIVPASSSSSSSSSNPNFLSIAAGNSSLWFFAKVFLLSHGTFLATSFLTAATSTALVKSTHPHPEKEKHEQEETMKIGFAYYGPLAFAIGVAVASWCKTSINNNPFEEDDGGFLSQHTNSSSSSNITSSSSIGKVFPARFIPFYLLVLAFVRDLFFSDHAPTHSEFMLGIATRGPLFFGVLNAMWVTWFYFRFVEPRTEFENNNNSNNNTNNTSSSSPTLVTNYGNSSARFALHRFCPIPFISEKILLPAGNFMYSKVLRIFTSYGGTPFENKWTEFLANVVVFQEHRSNKNNNSVITNNGNSTSGNNNNRSRRNSFSSNNNRTQIADDNKNLGFNNALLPPGTTVVNITNNGNNNQQKPNFAPLPGSSTAEADRRRELAMAALQARLTNQQQQIPSLTNNNNNSNNCNGTAGAVVVVVADVDEGTNDKKKNQQNGVEEL